MRTAWLLLLAPIAAGLPTSAADAEVLTDRCSAEVAFPQSYDGKPGSGSAVILKRNANGRTQPVTISVKTSPSGYIRWWCRSTTGNMFDPGTWRIENVYVGGKCGIASDGSSVNCGPDASLKLGSSAWNGWTPERSRCKNRKGHISVALGPNRLLSISCLGGV